MKSTDAYASAQPVCPGCATSIQPGLAMGLRVGRIVPVCVSCYRRAQSSPIFERQLTCAAMTGVTLPDVQRLFAKIGAHTVPTTAEGFDAALGRQPGSADAALGGGAPR